MADVPSAVLSQTKNLRTREAMLLGSSLEGGWYAPYPVGDSGTSFGPYQMHEGGALTALGLTPKQAENANTATKAMLPGYQQAVASISDAKWKSDPEGAAEQAAFIAEAPAQDYYVTQGAGTINANWANVNAVLTGKKSTGGRPDVGKGGGGGGGGNPSQNPVAAGVIAGLGALGLPVPTGGFNFKSDLERLGLVIFGAFLVIIGIVIFAIPAAKQAAKLTTTGKTLGLGGGAAKADIARRQDIANRSLAIGEKNAQTKAIREQRLASRRV